MMMKKVIIGVVFIFIGVAAQAQKTAKMEFQSETKDYGQIEKGSDGECVFEFTNTGNAPLVISAVKSTLGSAIISKPENPILPGETGKIKVKYDTNIVGPIRKTITVYSNAEDPNKSLKLKGRVVE